MTRASDPTAIACTHPGCSAAAGERCRLALGTYAQGEVHIERHRAAKSPRPA